MENISRSLWELGNLIDKRHGSGTLLQTIWLWNHTPHTKTDQMLMKDLLEDDFVSTFLPKYPLSSTFVNSCFNTCSGFKTTLIILGALVAFSIGGYVCKRINDLHHETPFEDGNHKQSWYFILGLGALLMFGAGIGLAYWSVHRIYGSAQFRTIRGFTRQESQYEEIWKDKMPLEEIITCNALPCIYLTEIQVFIIY